MPLDQMQSIYYMWTCTYKHQKSDLKLNCNLTVAGSCSRTGPRSLIEFTGELHSNSALIGISHYIFRHVHVNLRCLCVKFTRNKPVLLKNTRVHIICNILYILQEIWAHIFYKGYGLSSSIINYYFQYVKYAVG